MFEGASNMVEGVDRAFAFIFGVAFIFIIGITIFMIWTVIRFNRKKGHEARQFRGSVRLEVLWTVIPLILVLMMFYYGWVGFAPMRKVPEDAMRITAIGRMWEWEFDYGDGRLSRELVIPVNKPVRIDLKSEDVNHSLFIPAFRVKEDVVPGYNNFLWFIPYYVGEFDIYCTEYCGLLHSSMTSKTRVMAQEEFDAWLAELAVKAAVPVPEGFTLLRNTGCLACHSLDGSKLVGPSFLNYWGTERVVVEGETEKSVTADEEYTMKSIYDPNSQVVKGYARGLMQSYTNVLSEEDAKKMIEYLKELASGK
ncbi:MAG: cytochrome c oxidase subunit II [Bacteroidales bacterium]|nr:cytochrome c oxidase subunit II [Bacteroidales bacterium]